MAEAQIEFEVFALYAVETNVPALDAVTMTNVITPIAKFDDTTQERLNGKFRVPADIDSAGTVTFEASGQSATAAASKNVAFEFEHAAVAGGEDVDSASYTAEASGDKATSSTQNAKEVHTWTETVANLGWQPGDYVYCRWSRKAAGANNLSGDWNAEMFVARIPLA